eukprot:scaffold235664_cov15-Prasinocladus_malaysianus.AAC.1
MISIPRTFDVEGGALYLLVPRSLDESGRAVVRSNYFRLQQYENGSSAEAKRAHVLVSQWSGYINWEMKGSIVAQ